MIKNTLPPGPVGNDRVEWGDAKEIGLPIRVLDSYVIYRWGSRRVLLL